MRGSEFLLHKGKKNNDAAIQMFEHAVSIDPNFPLAYAGLAEAYSYNYTFYDGDRSWLEKAMKMNEKALDLDPDLIEAQISIGLVYFFQNRLTEAAHHLEKVLPGLIEVASCLTGEPSKRHPNCRRQTPPVAAGVSGHFRSPDIPLHLLGRTSALRDMG